MTLEKRINAFHQLGEQIKNLRQKKRKVVRTHRKRNPWFTDTNVDRALNGVSKFLDQKALETCLAIIPLKFFKEIGVAMAGIFVGWLS